MSFQLEQLEHKVDRPLIRVVSYGCVNKKIFKSSNVIPFARNSEYQPPSQVVVEDTTRVTRVPVSSRQTVLKRICFVWIEEMKVHDYGSSRLEFPQRTSGDGHLLRTVQHIRQSSRRRMPCILVPAHVAMRKMNAGHVWNLQGKVCGPTWRRTVEESRSTGDISECGGDLVAWKEGI